MFHFAPRQPTVRGWFYFISRLEAWKCLVSTGLTKKKKQASETSPCDAEGLKGQKSYLWHFSVLFFFWSHVVGCRICTCFLSAAECTLMERRSLATEDLCQKKKNPVLFNRTFKWTLPVKGAGLTQGPPDLLTAWQHWNLTFPARTLLAALVVTPPTRATTRRRHRPKTGLLPVLGEWGFGGGGWHHGGGGPSAQEVGGDGFYLGFFSSLCVRQLAVWLLMCRHSAVLLVTMWSSSGVLFFIFFFFFFLSM